MDRPEMPTGLSLTRATPELTALTAPAAAEERIVRFVFREQRLMQRLRAA